MSVPVRRGLKAVLEKRPDDVVIVTALRTPFGKVKGSLKDTYPEELLSHVLKATRTRLEEKGVDVQGGKVEDISTGTALMELGGCKSGRLSALHAGFPHLTTFRTTNRVCSSSLQSLTDIAQSIQSGTIDMGIAAGTESMTKDYGTRAIPVNISPDMKNSPNEEARDCMLPMGLTSEAVAEKYGITRERQDQFAVNSQNKAEAAQEAGRLADEIVPITTRYTDKETGQEKQITVEHDEGIRKGVTLEKLAKLKPVFGENGKSTAGNSSQVTDGAGALTLVRRDVAESLGLKPLGRFVGTAVKGCPPKLMGIGPAVATPPLLERFGLTKDDIDIFELNEAFASQALMVMDTLGLDQSKVNPNGGAIAIGHPLGATGARLVITLLNELHRQGKELGVATLCCGTGFGKASLFVAEH